MRRAYALSLLALASIVSTSLAAQKREDRGYRPPPPTITATPFALAVTGFDRNGDMLVALAEAEAGAAQSFGAADKDGNGKLSLIELADWSEAALGNRGALPGQFDFDRDGDDSISREEFVGLFQTRFATMDSNKDNTLQRSELISYSAAPRPSRRQRD